MLDSRDDSSIVLTAYKIPLSVIAEWPAPNYVNPTKRFWAAPFSIVLAVLSTLVIAARIYARITRTAGAFGLDDTLIIFAWVRSLRSDLRWWLTSAAIRCIVHRWDSLWYVYAVAGYPTSNQKAGVLHAGFDLHVWDVPPSLAAKGGFVSHIHWPCCIRS